MKITILAPYTFGYIDALVAKLREYEEAEVTYIQYQHFRYRYKSAGDRAYNFLLKLTGTGNFKKNYISQEIKAKLNTEGKQDYILVIRPDNLEKSLLPWLKGKTENLMSYYFDAIKKFPVKEKLIPFFDKVYSYEKSDVAAYNLEFITNFIPDDEELPVSNGKGVFNISSRDKRIKILQKIAVQLESHNFPYTFIVRSEKQLKLKHIKVIQKYISLDETRKYIEQSSVLLDIQKDNQQGLTFRAFEVLQFKKKLITTNTTIKNYDFYNENNILVIDKNNLVIDPDFLVKPYQPLPENLLKTYRRTAWIEKVFGLKNEALQT